MLALIAAAALSTTNLQPSPSPFHPFTLSPVDPLTTRWTFGAHEPMTMYRRMGRRSTGAIDGNALWTRDWLNWFDDHAPEKMQEMGFNYIHSRFYKGMGWEVEKKDFPNVRKFVRNCHAHGVRTLAYVQFGTLYPEMMRREIPQIDDWCGRDIDGRPNIYLGNYFRWMPCLNCREWEDYLKRMCTIALTEGGFDGIMFDNVFDVPCHCKRCERLFREWMAAIPDPEDRFGLPHVENVMLPPLKPWQKVTGRQMRDPVMQAWVEWRCETMTGLLMRLRAHIKSVKPDAQVSGNPTPYRNLADCQWKAQNMIEMSPAFDVIVMQNENYPEVKEGRISNRVRDFKFAQDLGQTLVALCDDIENLFTDREKKFILPMMEDVVFGGIPTDRTSMFPSPEEGFLNAEVWERRKPIHRRFNDFVNAHRTELSAPTVHSVRIFYPEREILRSPETSLAIGAAEEIFLRNRVPYGYLIGYPDKPLAVPEGTEVVVVPGVATLSDRQIAALVKLAKGGMKMVVTGDAGRYNEWNAQRRTNTFLPQLAGLPNVVCRAKADVLPKAIFGWGYKVDPPTDGGAAMMADLKRVGWRAPVDFENLPPHVLAEYRRLADGSLAVHLLNYMPEQPITGAKLRLPKGATAAFEAPLGKNPARARLTDGATLPDFVEYALLALGEKVKD